MNAFVVRSLYFSFYFDGLKCFVFVAAQGVWAYEDTIDDLLYFMEINYYCPLVA